jgi:DNA-binding transcriptional MocR family regulator
LVTTLLLSLQASALHTSGISQALLASVLTSWGAKVI